MSLNSRGLPRLIPSRSNNLAVFNEVLFDAPVQRSDIAKRTNLTAASVSRITRQLIDAGLIEEFEHYKTGRPGRSHVNLRLRHDAGYVAGISVNAFEQRVAIANLQREVIADVPLPRDRMLNPKRAAEVAASYVKDLLKKHRIPRSRLVTVGVASAGVVNSEAGVVIYAPSIGWTNVPLAREIEKSLGVPVRMRSMANALAAAEYRFGASSKFHDFIVVHATLGIGMGIVSDGQPVRGHRSHAGLIGETRVTDKNGRTTTLNDVAGGAALYAKWANLKPLSPREVPESLILELIEAANSGDRRANAICEDGATYLANTVTTLATALDSEAIMLVGPLVRIETYRKRLESVFRTLMGKEIEITMSARRGVEAAYLLAINELAATGVHLKKLQKSA